MARFNSNTPGGGFNNYSFLTANTGIATISTADSGMDGTNSVTVLTAGANGTMIKTIIVKATAAVTNGMISSGNTISDLFHKKDSGRLITEDQAGIKYRMKAKAVYEKAVFYFSLVAKMKYQLQNVPAGAFYWVRTVCPMCFINLNAALSPGYQTQCYFFPYGRTPQKPTPPVPLTNAFPTTPIYSVTPYLAYNRNTLVWRPFGGRRQLHSDYYMEATFNYIDAGIGQPIQVNVSVNL